MERELANIDPSQPGGAAGNYSRSEFSWGEWFILTVIDLGGHCLGVVVEKFGKLYSFFFFLTQMMV